jgi:hypothetical protein
MLSWSGPVVCTDGPLSHLCGWYGGLLLAFGTLEDVCVCADMYIGQQRHLSSSGK